jgi:hypothetical protein
MLNSRPPLISHQETTMDNLQLTLTAEERQYLITSLEAALKERRIEEHRTRTPSYREHVIHQEDVITGLLNKLKQPTS